MQKKFLILFLIFSTIFFSACSENKDKKLEIYKNNKILAFGDSLTFGKGVKKEENYPYLLEKELNKRNLNIKIDNEGKNGELSKDGLKRLKRILNKKEYNILILMHGGNDILQRKSKIELKDNLQEMINLALKKNIKIILIPVPKMILFGLKDLKLYKELKEKNNIFYLENALVDIINNNKLKVDYVHPNKKGYEKLVKKLIFLFNL